MHETRDNDDRSDVGGGARLRRGAGGPRGGDRPHFNFVFPISVVSQDGELITLEDENGLLRLRAECGGTFDQHGPRGHGHHGLSCFEVVFPITPEADPDR